jgi:hypothetical protein
MALVAGTGASQATPGHFNPPKGATFMAKSLDESVLLPKDIAGRKVIVQGVVKQLPAKGETEEQHAHHACADPRPPAGCQRARVMATATEPRIPARSRSEPTTRSAAATSTAKAT